MCFGRLSISFFFFFKFTNDLWSKQDRHIFRPLIVQQLSVNGQEERNRRGENWIIILLISRTTLLLGLMKQWICSYNAVALLMLSSTYVMERKVTITLTKRSFVSITTDSKVHTETVKCTHAVCTNLCMCVCVQTSVPMISMDWHERLHLCIKLFSTINAWYRILNSYHLKSLLKHSLWRPTQNFIPIHTILDNEVP